MYLFVVIPPHTLTQVNVDLLYITIGLFCLFKNSLSMDIEHFIWLLAIHASSFMKFLLNFQSISKVVFILLSCSFLLFLIFLKCISHVSSLLGMFYKYFLPVFILYRDIF